MDRPAPPAEPQPKATALAMVRAKAMARELRRSIGIVDADGVGAAASRTGRRDQHGLQQRSRAKQNAAGGEHEKRQFWSVSVDHGSRG